jgi:predicted short-subunit dehydrogenase-like oxidoreductase (DUF2520 family)
MNSAPGTGPLWIVGAGRAGLALGLSLFRAGWDCDLVVCGRDEAAPEHPLFEGAASPARYTRSLPRADEPVRGLVLAVPDAALAEVASAVASTGRRGGEPALHLSGAYGAAVLAPLASAGWSTGALHPLAAVAEGTAGADRLRLVWWGVEATGAALGLATAIVDATDGRMLRIAPGAKPVYHAAAVFASNYVVALLGVAERLMADAGVDAEDARDALTALAEGAVENVADAGPAAALTGPVARGDDVTVRAHLEHLSGGDRPLYCRLAAAALDLARAGGADEAAVERIERALEEAG